MKRLLTIAAALAALTGPAAAEVKKDGHWRGSATAGISYSSGNTEANSFNLGAQASRATDGDRIALSATAQRGQSETDGVTTKTAEMFKLGGRYDRDLTPRHFAFGGLGFEHDRLQQLDLRSSLNAGVGYHVLADEVHSFDLFGGLGASSERFETLTRDFAEAVLGEESSHKITADTSLRQRLAFYPNLEDAGEYRAEFEATLATALAAGWTFNVTLSSRYVSNPLPGLETTDTQLFVGVGGKFGPK